MTIFQRSEREVDEQRDAARSALNEVWPRGVWLDRDEAHRLMIRVARGAVPEWDKAAGQAMASSLVMAGLLVPQVQCMCDGYLRPAADIEPAKAPSGPQQVLWHPFDGGPARPYSEVQREQAEAARQRAAAPAAEQAEERETQEVTA